MDSSIPYLIVLIFSIVQSIIGVGLLLFGTPSLVLLGYSFSEALLVLLPPSIMISLLQVSSGARQIKIDQRIYYITVPALTIGLSIVLNNPIIEIDKLIGSMMLIIAALRISSTMGPWLNRLLQSYSTITYFVIGLIHGISNMGGGLLSLFTSSLYNDKYKIRINTAFAYMIFGVTQLVVIFWFRLGNFGSNTIALIILSISAFLVIERTVFMKIDNKIFHKIITLFVIIYSIILIY